MEKLNKQQFEKIFKRVTMDKRPSKKPIAFVMGGQPGAGKSSIAEFIENSFLGNNAVNISGDDYRKSHPDFLKLYEMYGDNYIEHTRTFASEVVEKLIEECSNRKYNILVEGTMRSHEVPLKTCEILKEKGYEVNLFVMATSPIISYIGTLKRYEKMLEIGSIGRKTTKEQHDITVNNIANNLEKIFKAAKFDNIVLMDRKQNILYEQLKTPEINPGIILKEHHRRKLTASEYKMYQKDLDYIIQSMKERDEEPLIIENVRNLKFELQRETKNTNINKNNDAEIISKLHKKQSINKNSDMIER